jgi:S-adenosylmethionine synthetase
MSDYLFTSESVTEGHPDKLCDRISDVILDDMLAQDEHSRVAVETFCITGLVLVGGEVTTKGYSDVARIVRDVILDVGYNSSEVGLDGRSCGVAVAINQQSPDIAGGVGNSLEAREGSDDPLDRIGAGDQGLMFGYACRDTDYLGAGHENVLMPMPIHLAHRLARRLTEVRKKGLAKGLRPDGKTQVTMRYPENECPSLHTVLVSAQHEPELNTADVTEIVRELVIPNVIPQTILPHDGWDGVKVLINPSGRFVSGGPFADTGLTGRKIIVDTYGGMARHGGGSFSGKDATKVDRSGSYYARYAAKNIVAAGLCDRIELQVAYAIGRANPLSLSFKEFGTAHVPLETISRVLNDRNVFDFRPASIIERLDLRKPIFASVSVGGHFGRTDLDLPWERLDKVDAIKAAI